MAADARVACSRCGEPTVGDNYCERCGQRLAPRSGAPTRADRQILHEGPAAKEPPSRAAPEPAAAPRSSAAQAASDVLVIVGSDAQRRERIAEIVADATGLSRHDAELIINSSERIECVNAGEARSLKAALERNGANAIAPSRAEAWDMTSRPTP